MVDTGTVELFRLQAEICKTLSDPNRLMLLHELRGREVSWSAGLSACASSEQRFEAPGRPSRAISGRNAAREGTMIYYRLGNPKIGEACDLVRDVLQSHLIRNQELAGSLQMYEQRA